MKLITDTSIRDRYPDLRIGVVVATNVDNKNYPDDLELYVKNSFKSFSEQYQDAEILLTNKNIQCWQETYRSFGVNPKKKKPTAEALLLRAIKNGFYPHINAVVDSYLVAQTLFCLPVGGYDLDRVSGNIVLRISDGSEKFLGVGSDSEEVTDQGEVIYADDTRILTRRWNYRDADYTKIDTYSKAIALFTEAPTKEISDDEISKTIMEIANNLRRFCNAETNTFILHNLQNEIVII